MWIQRVRRPATSAVPEFDLSYVRTGPRSQTPIVVIPGGPGLASVLPYRTLRRIAARGGLDLIMVEHRGVGFSRKDRAGRDLPRDAMRVRDVVDDLAAVLDREEIERAYIVGSSYGSYLASTFGAVHGGRVAGMLLDSALQSSGHLDLERRAVRELLWDGAGEAVPLVHAFLERGLDGRTVLDVARAAYELGGEDLLLPLLRQRLRHARSAVWKAVETYATRGAEIARVRRFYEFDLAGVIAFRELNYGAPPDGVPIDPALTYAPQAALFPAFAGEPFDLFQEMPRFDWPLVLLSGTRDLRTPPPIAERVARTAPDAVLVPLDAGHSALDTHPVALLNAVRFLVTGRHRELPSRADEIDRLPPRGLSARLAGGLRAALAVEVAVLR